MVTVLSTLVPLVSQVQRLVVIVAWFAYVPPLEQVQLTN